MAHVNIEIKARCDEPEPVRQRLLAEGADFRGTDRQVDTYFRVPRGRLKLRRGNIENTLIFYRRPDRAGPKQADVTLYPAAPGDSLYDLLTAAMDVLVEVRKTREIYFVGNVKFHIDTVEGLGRFIEIEAIDADGTLGVDAIRRQCDHWMRELSVRPEDLVEPSYSDLLMQRSHP